MSLVKSDIIQLKFEMVQVKIRLEIPRTIRPIINHSHENFSWTPTQLLKKLINSGMPEKQAESVVEIQARLLD